MTTNTERLNSALNLYDVYKHSNPSCSFPSWICDQLMAEEKQARIVEEPKLATTKDILDIQKDLRSMEDQIEALEADNDILSEHTRCINKLMAWARL